MSGHSHYATIKRQKESKDALKGKIFSKLAKEISIAAKVGGSGDIDSNYKLRVAVERARASNMPKENIDRAISKAIESRESLEEITYEGFGPSGISVIVEAATDNKNRTSQEIKNLFERGGGSLGGPGSVSYNFLSYGLVVVKKESNLENQTLKLIEIGAEDIVETDDSLEMYVSVAKLSEARKSVEDAGYKVNEFEITKKPKNIQSLTDVVEAKKALKFVEELESNESVQKVYTNLDISEEVLSKL